MSAPAWKGLFDWSIQHQSSEGPPPKQVTPEEQKWFQEAMAQYTVDHVGRMKHIKATLDQPDETADAVQKKQDMLEELLDIVDNIDYARDLHTIGGLPTLLSLLQDSHASIRWRAAEVVATCVQNNPRVQQWFMEGGAMPKLLHLLHDEDASCRTKALLALSCLIRLNPLALEVFRQKRGIPQLIQAADDTDIKVQRKALHLLRHVVHAHPPDAVMACQLGALHQAACHLASSDDDTWQAALALVQQLAENTLSAQMLQQDKQLQHQLQTLQAKLQVLTGEDREATEEELATCTQLMHSLYNTCSQSASIPQTQPSRPPASATAAAVVNGAPTVPQAQSHSNSSPPAMPLLLGPPS
ncbi:TPA: hypothetical protein ACH3X3_010256 [Trebouxia sp. C0006]